MGFLEVYLLVLVKRAHPQFSMAPFTPDSNMHCLGGGLGTILITFNESVNVNVFIYSYFQCTVLKLPILDEHKHIQSCNIIIIL